MLFPRAFLLSCSFFAIGADAVSQTRDSLVALIQQQRKVLRAGAVPTEAQQLILTLDTDGSGKVEKNEVEVFAKQQGISSADFMVEFNELDANNDGVLTAGEIVGNLGEKSRAPEKSARHEVAAIVAAGDIDTSVAQRSESQQKEQKERSGSEVRVITSTGDGDVFVRSHESPLHTVLNETILLEQAQHDAQTIIAQAFARSASAVLQQENEDEKKIAELDKLAQSLRSQADAITKTAEQRTSAAASQAADRVFRESQPHIEALDLKARYVEEKAAEHRQLALQAMDKVGSAQMRMREAMTSA